MKNLNDALTKARRSIQKHADPATQEALKGCRWLLVKRRANLTPDEVVQLETALQASADLKLCYDLKEAFRQWFDTAATRQAAAEQLTEWLAQVQASGVRALQALAHVCLKVKACKMAPIW